MKDTCYFNIMNLCETGEKLTVNLSCKRNLTDNRALIVTIEIDNHTYGYNVR